MGTRNTKENEADFLEAHTMMMKRSFQVGIALGLCVLGAHSAGRLLHGELNPSFNIQAGGFYQLYLGWEAGRESTDWHPSPRNGDVPVEALTDEAKAQWLQHFRDSGAKLRVGSATFE